MRWPARVLLALAALVAVALVALAVGLPRLARSDAVRARIESAALEATGREVRYGELDVGLFPPRLVVREPRIVPEAGGESPLAADAVSLELALWPLLARAVVVDSLLIEGARVRLVRTEDGIELPFRLPEDDPAAEEAPPEEDPREEEGFALALRRVALEGARLTLVDRSVEPAVAWELTDVDGALRTEVLPGAMDFALTGTLASGGELAVEGRVEQGGDVRAELELAAVRLDAAAPYLGTGQKAAGAASGRVTYLRTSGAPKHRLQLDLAVAEGALEADDLRIAGPFALQADLSRDDAPLQGLFHVDARDAEIRYGGAFVKPPGQEASARGRIVDHPQGLRLEQTQLRVRQVEATMELQTGARTRATVTAPPFALEGAETLVPALAGLAPRGRVAVPELRVATAPLEVHGRVELPDVRLRREDGPELHLRGAVEGLGDAVATRDLTLDVAGEPFRVRGEVARLATAPRYDAEVEADGVDSAALLRGFGVEDRLEGPLRLRAHLAGPLDDPRPLVESARGRIRFDVAPGRLRGVSLLRSTFEQLRSAREVAAALGGEPADVGRFDRDEFESLGGTFDVADGMARTDDLTLVYRHYTVELWGQIGLVDRRLDMAGRLTIDPEIDASLAGAGAGADAPAAGRSRTIRLARVTGTLDAPRVALSSDAILTFASFYATERRREKWEQKLDERLGEGAGEQVLDVLDDILGGGRR